MQEKTSFPQKKPFTPFEFFKRLSALGKVVFSFLGFFVVSLFVGVLVLLLSGDAGQKLRVSLRNLDKEPAPQELSLLELYESKGLGKEAGASADSCPQKIFAFDAVKKEDLAWTASVEGKQIRLIPPCSSVDGDFSGERLLLRLERCRDSVFAECLPFVGVGEKVGAGSARVDYYLKNYSAAQSADHSGFYARSTEGEGKKQVFLRGKLIWAGREGALVGTDYGVFEVGTGRGLTQVLGEEEKNFGFAEVRKGFVGSKVVLWVGLGKGGNLIVEKFAVIG